VGRDEEKVEELCKKALSAPALVGKSEELVSMTIELLKESLVGSSWKKFFPTPGRDPDEDNYADAFAARVAEMTNKALEKKKGKVRTVVRCWCGVYVCGEVTVRMGVGVAWSL
jgi:hypothetical protein